MLSIRFTRVGRKNAPSFRLIVQEKTRSPRSRHLEILGHYNPTSNPKTVVWKEDRIRYWLGVGAQPSETVHNLFVEKGLITGEKQKVVRISNRRKALIEAARASAQAQPAQ